MAEVVLVSMPFASLLAPSIALGLLKPAIAALGVSVRVAYLGFRFAERVGRRLYDDVADGRHALCSTLEGEWIFSRALFGDAALDPARYVAEILCRPRPPIHARGSETALRGRLEAYRRAAGFLDEQAEAIARERPRIVGFTSVFQQHVASLALARRIKERLPDTVVLFGGANCEGVMGGETVRRFPFVDAAVSGEGDLVVADLVRRALERRPIDDLPGVWTPRNVERRMASAAPLTAPSVARMDDLPYPDYDDFIVQFAASRSVRRAVPQILFESSRGCWWGEKSHCTFCGLNGATMRYRSKSSTRVLAELVHLRREYPALDVQVVDNILDMDYFADLLPELARRRLRFGLFYETKSNLKKEQLRLLHAADVRHIQPGIESFSDLVLRRMRKGVSALQNVQLLKWCEEIGIRPFYNVLWGFPGEPPEEYARMARIVPALAHLEPPSGASTIHIDRFAPVFTDAARLGLEDVRPIDAYRHVYPFDEPALANLAYFFSARHRDGRDVGAYTAPLSRALAGWRRRHAAAALFFVDVDDALLVWDLRPCATALLTVLRGLDRALYLACDAAHDAPALARALGARWNGHADPAEIEGRLDPLVASRLVLRERSKLLALALPLGPRSPRPRAVARFYAAIASVGIVGRGSVLVPRAAACAPPRGASRVTVETPRPLRASQFSIDERGDVRVRLPPSRTMAETVR